MSKPKQRRLTSFFIKGMSAQSTPSSSSNTTDSEQSTPSCSQTPDPSSDEKTSGDKGKIVRLFRTEWLKQNHWLRYENGKMTCTVCEGEGKDNPFTKGCTNFRNSTLVRHINSHQHKHALEAQSLRATMHRQTDSAIAKKGESIIGAMRTVYWLCKEQLPTLKYKSLINFLQIQGCKFPEELCVGSTNYTSHTSAEQMQDAISSVLTDDLNSKLQGSPYFALLLDESCDISVTKKLLLYVRILTDELEVETLFLDNLHIKDGTASTIHEAVKSTLISRNIDISKLIVIGSDGASVMTGKKNGFVALVKKEDSPFVIGIHCIAHRLALCTSQAAQKVPYLKSYQQILGDIFYYFKRSALRREKLKDIQTVLEDPHIMVKELHSVRWFSMYAALEAVYRCWPSLATLMETQVESSNDSYAKGFLKKMTTFVFIAVTYLLMDIIPKVTQLSLFFQKVDIDISMLRPSVDSVIQQLEWLISNDGNHLTSFMQEAGDKITEFKGVKVTDTPILREQFQKTRRAFITNIISELERRFPAVETDLVSCMAVLSMRGLFLMSADDRTQYGVHQITSLTEHYANKADGQSPLINAEETLQEWNQCKELVFQQQYPCHTVASTWKLLHNNHPESFPNLQKLSMIAILAPLQTATVERGFSVQNDIKVSTRNRLSSARLNVLMQISLGPPIEQFDFNSALLKWRRARKRKLFSAN